MEKSGGQPCRPARVMGGMDAFATLGGIYSTRAAVSAGGTLDDTSDRTRALNQFLREVELKAFRIARAGLRHDDDALDAVQDAMLQLARAYASRPAQEWKPLFYRILDNRVRDMRRRRVVRNRVLAWLPFRRDTEQDDADDPISHAPSPDAGPVARLEGDAAMRALARALEILPHRQRQAFLLRTLEGLDVAQTAAAMGCSEGSVKTHLHRALHALRASLQDFAP
jgi:RNA polymerase sigma-70 factor, ECF subfamily